MNLTLLTSSFNPHLEPLARALQKRCDVFHFIACASKGFEARAKGGFFEKMADYVITKTDSDFFTKAQAAIAQSDIIIVGSGDEELLAFRKEGSLLIRYNEHFSKREFDFLIHAFSVWRKRRGEGKSPNSLLLCASTFAANDFGRIHLYDGRKVIWGYFPKGNVERKRSRPVFSDSIINLLWCGRMLNWKHPELCFAALDLLFSKNIPFHMTFVGGGPCEKRLQRIIAKKPYHKSVIWKGMLSYPETLEEMLNADICLFTSSRREGWGGVLNEYMSSECVVVASSAAGATGFLVEDGENGFSFSSKKEMLEIITYIIENKEKCIDVAANAKLTIETRWNGEVAATNLLSTCSALVKGSEIRTAYPPYKPGLLLKDK